MSLTSGTRLGPYEVLGSLGAGGMGEVYRARDTKLDRDVALKILPDHFAGDPERLARFEREAKTLASLNHPHIAQIYGFEEGPAVGSGFSPTRALVMELVDGEDLSQRIARLRASGASAGQAGMPLDELLPIARQIAEALEAAHDQGIIHRDLKPANVKVKADGTVKVLDFGLAKAMNPEGDGFSRRQAEAANSPTLTAHATVAGIILGTAAYMSPEQARGKAVDRRADIWAFGVVCYEMLAGRRAFDGEEISDVLAAVLRQDITWTALPAATPPLLRQLLERCLDRDAKQRLRDIGEARVTIDRIISGAPMAIDALAASPNAVRPAWRRALPAMAVVVASALTGLGVWALSRPAPARPLPVQRLPLTFPESAEYPGLLAVSPDGTQLVYIGLEAGKRLLLLRRLDQLDAQPIRGTDGGVNPFFSPDGEWIGFFVRNESRLKKVAVKGGAALTLAETTGSVGAWLADDTIVFTRFTERGWELTRVPAAGGAATSLTTPDPANNEYRHAFPEPLPGGNDILFSIFDRMDSEDNRRIAVLSLATGKYRTIIERGYHARYVPSGLGSPKRGQREGGHLVYMLDGNLMAVPFDLARLQTMGPPVPVVEDVPRSSNGEATFAVSRSGFLVYALAQAFNDLDRTLVWVDRSGHQELVGAPPRGYMELRLSPDGMRIALDIRDQNNDVWVWDLARQNLTRLTFFPQYGMFARWARDGRRIFFGSRRGGAVLNLYWQAADGSGQAERLAESQQLQRPHSVSPDGTRLLFTEEAAKTRTDIHMLSLDDRKAVPLIRTPFRESNPEVSPDGRWLAYQSDESGATQVYVRPFPAVDTGRWQVSTDGGSRPVWARNGRELFYAASVPADESALRMMAVPIQAGATFAAGAPEQLFEGRFASLGNDVGRNYDVSADGQKFLMIKEGATEQTANTGRTFVFVMNWFDELRRLAPPR